MVNVIKNRLGKFLKICLIFLLVIGWVFSGWPRIWEKPAIPPEIQELQAASETFTSSGTFTASTGIYSVSAECWGGGGGGGGSSRTGYAGGGGGGGAYSKLNSYSVTPGTGYTVTVGAAGSSGVGNADGGAGGDSSFVNTTTLLAKGGGGGRKAAANAGGAGGSGGASGSGVGDTKYSGGAGAAGSTTVGGGGGGGAGDAANGGDASGQTKGTGGTIGGGDGGNGGASQGNGADGTVPGGAGGGGGNKGTVNTNGGSGAAGKCIITYTDTWAPSVSQTSYDPTWTFATAPNNDAGGQISMTATTGYDYTTPINYLFTLDNTNCGADAGTGGNSSSWQSSTSYTDTGLDPNKCYGYTVTSRDSVATPNTGTASAISSTYSSANTPGTPTLNNPTETTLNLTNDANSNPSSNPTTYFAVQVTYTNPSDTDWQDKWVDASGNPSASEVWQTDAALDALVLQGLNSGTTYGVKVKARNQDNDETSLSTEGQGTTQSAAPTLTFSISDNTIEFGTLSASAVRWADDSGGSATEVSAHTMSASTNGSGGYTITVNGNTLTHTNPSYTITAIGGTAVDVTAGIGTEQFGIRLTASGGNGAVSAPYNGASNYYAFDTASFPDQVASDPDGDDVPTTYSVFYAANIANTTEAGSYSAILTYIATGNF